MQSGLLRIIVVAMIALVGVVALLPRTTVPPPEAATEWPQPRPLPLVEFRNAAGMTFSTADLRERFSLVFFGFTNCPDICPTSMAVLAQAMQQLGDSSTPLPRVVLISVDPARDDPAALRAYLDRFDETFQGLTTNEAALAPLLDALGVHVMKQSLGNELYTVTHNPQVFVVSPAADVIATLSSATDPAGVARDYRRIRARFLSGATSNAAPPQ